MSSRFLTGVGAVLCLLGATAAQAAVTYGGTNGVYNQVFTSNGVQSCLGCHSSSLVGAARQSAPSGVNFDTYAWATTSDNAERASVRVNAGSMPPNGALSAARKAEIASWAANPVNTAAASVSTDSATSGKFNANFSGTATENGIDTAFSFKYSTSQSTVDAGNGNSVAALGTDGNSGGNNTNFNISASVSSLACGTTYYYRAHGGGQGVTRSVNTTSVGCARLTTDFTSFTISEDDPFAPNAGSVGETASAGSVTYSLTNQPAGMSINSTTGVISWTVPQNLSASTLYNNIVITSTGNTIGDTSTDTFSVTVNPVNDAPVISSTTAGHTAATEGVLYTFDVDASDIEGNTLSWSLQGAGVPAGMSINSSNGVISWMPAQALSNYSHSFNIVVTDNGSPNQSDTLPITINVAADNDAPTITTDATLHTSATEGLPYSYDVNASDPENQTLSYSLLTAPAGMTIDSSTGVISWLPPQALSNYSANVTVRASDGTNITPQSFTINVAADNDAPALTSSPVTTAAEQVTYTYDVDASDPENQTLSYSLSANPAGMTINSSTGVISWLPPEAGATYTANVTVQVSDGSNTVPQSFTITVTSSNDPPAFTSTDVVVATEGVAYSYDVNASDPEGGSLSYSLPVKPSGMSINSSTGVISWIPPQAVASYTENVTVQVTDGANPVQHGFVITVSADNDAPSIISAAVTTAVEDSAYSYDVNATDPEGQTLTYGLSTRPAGMTINSSTGVIDWTPPLNSNAPVNVVATVSDGTTTVSQPFTITITPVNDAPTFTSTAVTTLVEDTPYSYDVNATDVDGDTLSYSLLVKPTGMTIDSSTGVISWTPPLNSNAAVNVTVQVQDNGTGNLTATQAFTITITAVNDAPVLAAIANQNVTAASFALQPVATDVDNTTAQLAWTFTGNPAGMSIVPATGRITWAGASSLTCATAAACTSTVNVTVKDPGNLSASRSFSFVIVDTDSDTIPDYRDNCPAVANTNQADIDHDNTGDLCDSDADGDGIPNAVETANGLDPLNAADAAQDKDHDGLSNLQEYQACNTGSDPTCSNISIDSVAPVVTPAADVSQNATGYFTPVRVSATATDIPDGAVTTSLFSIDGVELTSAPANPYPFRPGTHALVWQARDKAGNTGSAPQTVTIKPLLSLGGHDVTGVTGTVYVSLRLNGESPQYPVTVNYSTGGTAVAGTHYGSLPGTVTFNSGETLKQIPVSVLAVGPDRTLTLQLQSVSAGAAALGDSRTYTLDITSRPEAPIVSLRALQNSEYRQVVYRNDGNITLEALVSDPNGGAPVLTWNAGSVAATQSGNTLVIAGNAFTAGAHVVRVTATDSGGLSASRSLTLLVLDGAAPVLSALADTDGDGIVNATEGSVDANGNGILDYLDAQGSEAPESILLRLGSGSTLLLMAEADDGLQMKAGQFAVAAQSVQTPQAGIQIFASQVDPGTGVITDPGHAAIGAIYDFEVAGLGDGNRVAHVVLPLPIALIDGAQWRELSAGSRWTAFAATGGDEIRSAQRVNGQCPGPQSAAYQPGLIAGNDCVQLTVTDGGPNDADGQVNGSVSVTASPSVTVNTATPTAPTESQSGGSLDLYSLMLLALGILILRRKEQVR